jgi:hypothetical protein
VRARTHAEGVHAIDQSEGAACEEGVGRHTSQVSIIHNEVPAGGGARGRGGGSYPPPSKAFKGKVNLVYHVNLV